MIERRLAEHIRGGLSYAPVVLLHGPRQSGKSTLAQLLVDHSWPARYVTLDDVTVLASARLDPQGFVESLDAPVVIDEIQRAPELLLPIKLSVDRERTPGRFLLTGSANVLTLPRLSDTLAGRMDIQTLRPLAQLELEGGGHQFLDELFAGAAPRAAAGQKVDEYFNALLRGGFPPAALLESDRQRQAWFDSYLTTVVERDVRDLSQITGLAHMPRLLELLAARAPTILNLAELSRALGLPHATLTRYMALLQSLFLITLLPAWSGHLSRRLVKSPKLAIADTGLMLNVLRADKDRLRSDRTLWGRALENLVITELEKEAGWCETRPRLLHYRSVSGQEVDVVLEDRAGRVVGIEVKASATLGGQDTRGLRALAEDVGDRFVRGVVLYTGSSAVSLGPRISALPIASLWRAGDPLDSHRSGWMSAGPAPSES